MPDAKFLEEYSLYRKLSLKIPHSLNYIDKPAINMMCHECKGVRTFTQHNQYFENYKIENASSEDEIVRAAYLCVACRKFRRYFFIKISPDLESITKIGQYPPWSIAGDHNIESMLGKHQALYRKGLISESQGYGIGAFAYYRRILEEIIDGLLEQVEKLLASSEKESYLAALENVKKTRIVAEKINLVRDLLPPILCPDGKNPLSLLHGILSEGLHADTDERCLELAVETREILIFLAATIARTSNEAKIFTMKMQSLLEKKKIDNSK